jgi:hypothetical protein
MKQVVFNGTSQTTRVTYSNFWYGVEVFRVYKWVKVCSYRNLETAVSVLPVLEQA